MNAVQLDFEQARAKHLLFKSRLRALLYGIEVDDAPVVSQYECNVGKWIYSFALAAYGHLPEMQELEKVHAEIHTAARKLVSLYKEGKTEEARNGLSEMEQVADRLVEMLTQLEQRLQRETKNTPAETGPFEIKVAEFQDMLKANFELDKRLKEQVAQIEAVQKQLVQKAKEATAANQVLRDFFMQTPAIMGILRGPAHVYELANDDLQQLFGYRDLIGKSVREAIPELEGQGFYELLDNVYTTGQTFEGKEMPVQVDKGKGLEQVYLNFLYQAFKDQAGQTQGILVFAYDVTEQVTARQKIERSKAKYQALFESIDQGFCIIEVLFDENNQPHNWLFLEVNAAFEKQNGLKEATGKTILELAPGIEPHWFKIYGQVALTGEPIRFTEGSDALNRWFDLYAFKLPGDDNNRVAVLFTDITAQKQAEIILRESEARFRSLADNSPMMIFILEPDIEAPASYWNKTWLDFTGQTFQQALGRSWDGIVHADDVPEVMAIYVPAFQHRVSYTIPAIRLKRHDDVFRWHYFKANPRFLPNGEFIGYIGTAVDIDEQKKTEEALRESEKQLKQSYEDLETKVTFRNLELEQLNKTNERIIADLKSRLEKAQKN